VSTEHDHQERRAKIKDVARGLRELHRQLVDTERAAYEELHGDVGGPGNLLQLLLHDESFAWMRVMSELMVDIDELLDVHDISEADAAAVRVEVEWLISPAEGEVSPFAERYKESLQRDPSLVLTHSTVRQALRALPEASERTTARTLRPHWSARRLESRKSRADKRGQNGK
jgi:hypothetical protein